MPPSERDVAAIYQELLLDHYRRPRNRGRIAAPDAAVRKRNPSCGDQIELQIALDGDVVRELKFVGEGCTISQASASMMTQLLAGKSVSDAARLAHRFAEMIHGDAEAARDPALGELRALAGVSKLPNRVTCAMLP
jgi:nitrogen fixation NifU-like protein